MAVLYWVLLVCYICLLSLGMAFLGVNWYRLETKFKRSPQRLIVGIYTVNFLLMFYGFGVPFLIQFIINIL